MATSPERQERQRQLAERLQMALDDHRLPPDLRRRAARDLYNLRAIQKRDEENGAQWPLRVKALDPKLGTC